MIRALALASLLSACSYDATLGSKQLTSQEPDAAPAAFDASTFPDVPANLAFDYGNAGGPIVVDGSFVYSVRNLIASSAPDRIIRADTANTVENPIDFGWVRATAMAQDATMIYALALGSSPGLFDVVSITKTPTWAPSPDGTIDAGLPTFVTTTLVSGLTDAAAIAVDGSSLYIVESGGSDGKLLRMDKTGANATTLLADSGLSAVAVDASFAYVVEHAPQGRLLAVPKAGGMPLVLASQLVEPLAIDLADSAVYITEQGDASTGGSIGRVTAPQHYTQQSGVAMFERIVTGAHTPVDLTHDDTYIYWTADRDGLMRAPLAGGSPELRLGTAAPGNAAVAVGASYVFFASPGDYGGHMVHVVQR